MDEIDFEIRDCDRYEINPTIYPLMHTHSFNKINDSELNTVHMDSIALSGFRFSMGQFGK